MKTSFNISPYIKGTLQGRQTPDALATDHFLVDERTKLDWMAYVSQVGRVLDFHAVNGSVEGTWESFLLSDVSLLTARIAQTHRVQEYNQFITLYEALKDQEQIHRNKNYLPTLFALGFEVATLIDAWYKMSKQSFAVSSVATFLTERIQTVGITNVSTFYQLYQKLKRKVHFEEPNNLHLLQQLSSVWKFNPLVEIKKQEQNTTEEDLLKQIQKAGQELFQLPSEINRWAAAEFERSLQRKDMPPHIGLMATFFDLFREQQKAINTITKRHLEFYYQSVLQSQKKPALPDHTIVVVELAKGVEKLTLTKGATISGSTVEGEPVAFQVKEDTVVNAAKIARYFTLNFPCDDVNVGSDTMILGTVSNFNEIGNTSWPIFGGGLSTPNWSPQPFTLGWAFSCSDLLLAQGTRSLTIVFTCKSFEAELSGIDFSSLFEIKLTAKEGWHTAAINQVQYQADGQLKFILNLAPTDPSIITYDKKIHGTGYDTTWPICAVTLTDRGKQQFDVLSKWSVDKVSVATDVKGVCDFLIENESGKLPNTAPFIPFNEPLPGSNLYVGGQEFYVKCLTQLDLTIVWDKLPADFQEYYSAYNTYYQEKGDKKQKASLNLTSGSVQEQPILNQSFKAKVYELDGDSWKAVSKEGNNRVEYCLFTEDPTKSVTSAVPQLPLVKNAQKKISLKGPFRFNPQLQVYTGLNNNLREGFFCLSLSSPSQGFGSVDYPIIVSTVTMDNSAALMHNARLVKLHKLPIKPLPAIPYVPKMKGMEVDYQSAQSYPLDATSNFVKWYHLHPFGIEPVPFHEELPKLLPTYPAQAYAYWGVESLAPNNHLSVLITVESKSKSIHKASPDDFIFEYRSAHGWRKMLVVSDGTEGFQRSGEIRLSIPTDIVKGGINLPESFYWLRCGQS
ncbi:MAG: hypothetical protein HOP30_06750, partial [Cyclobacteriaceae bacterium]|nr:hypothetical protein [Cyclobacteriaceae bacterium]